MRLPQFKLEPSWRRELAASLAAPYFQELLGFLDAEQRAGRTYFPPDECVFSAFNLVPFDDVKVVVVGQDPYHGDGQAHGLSFSVPEGIPIPPSLRNIFKEVADDTGSRPRFGGNLEGWARQGVLLMNTTLTVEAGKAGSHFGKGWEQLTDDALRALNEKRSGLVFLLWGRHAIGKARLVDTNRHHVLTAPHPSPLSAHKGFLGCRHFSQANKLLRAEGVATIDWAHSN